MARLATTVLLSSPETGEPVVLLAGDEVPAWADGLIGDHCLESSEGEPEQSGESEGEPEKPAGNASLEEWTAYALSQGYTEADLEGMKRDDIRALFG